MIRGRGGEGQREGGALIRGRGWGRACHCAGGGRGRGRGRVQGWRKGGRGGSWGLLPPPPPLPAADLLPLACC